MKKSIAGRLLSLLLTLAVLAALAPAALAVEGDSTPEETPGDEGSEGSQAVYTLTGVTLTESITLKVGESTSLNAGITLSDGTTQTQYQDIAQLPDGFGVDVSWSVALGREDEVEVTPSAGNPLSITVKALELADTNEPIKAVAITVTVTPTGGGEAKISSCNVTVAPSDPSGVTISPTTLELAPTHTGQLTATVTPDTAPQTVTWRSGDTSVATVDASGLVTGVSAGNTQVFATSSTHEASCAVTVLGIVLQDASGITINEGDRRQLEYKVYGTSLQGSGITWTSSDSTVVKVDSGYLYALQPGTAVITAKVDGTSYEDTCTVTVKRNTASVITASASSGSPLYFSTLVSAMQDRCSSVLGQSLSFVSGLSVSTDQGTLYYRYISEGDTGAGIGTGERFYVSPSSGQMSLSQITFVPKADFSGTAVISYTGYASGTSFFQGTIEVSVAAQQNITYSTSNGAPVQLDPYDFAVACTNRTGRDLSYITFSLPDSSDGTLYYNYLSPENPGTAVRDSTQYKYSGTPSLGSVYFVPADGFDGQTVLYYTGWNTNGESYQGRVVIQVGAKQGSGDIRYNVTQGNLVDFDVDDFSALSRNLTGSTLDCVRFTLPAASQGTLYYNYSSSSSERVSQTKSYYRASSPYLDRVSFLAADGYTGTVSISFTGWAINGKTFSGTVSIHVGTQGDTITYRTYAGDAVEFQISDFNDLSLTVTGSSLRYVRFTLPAASRGTLYYNYNNGNYTSKVSATQSYYRSSYPYINQVSFVPNANYSGTTTISFTGWATDGSKFTGSVEITVGASNATTIYYTTTHAPVTFRSTDFRTACADRGLGTLTSVQFTTTSPTGGHLYSQFNGLLAANTEVRSTTKYYPGGTPDLSAVTFVPQAEFSGTARIFYTGTDSKGKTFQGQVQITVTPNVVSSYFSDLGVGSAYSWAAASVDLLYENNVVSGTGGGYYSPGLSVSRADFLVMLDRIFQFPRTSQVSFPDVPANSYYAGAVQAAYSLGIVTGYSDGSFHPTAPVTRAEAASILYRAMQKMGWSIASENPSLLSSYSDSAAVPSYARGAMSALLQSGIMTGTSSNTLEPNRVMSRAETAVVLSRLLTL